jgi:hypothetical protein
MSKARALREQREAAKKAARERKLTNAERVAKERARKLEAMECRCCTEPAKVDERGRVFRMCQGHLDMDAKRKERAKNGES